MSTVEEILLTSVIIAIPIGIITNLLSSPIQRRVDKALKRSGERRDREREVYARQITAYADDSIEFHTYLMEQILRTTFYTAIFGLITGLLFALSAGVGTVGLGYFGAINLLNFAAQLVGLIGTFIVLSIARNALRTTFSVRSIKDQPQLQNPTEV